MTAPKSPRTRTAKTVTPPADVELADPFALASITPEQLASTLDDDDRAELETLRARFAELANSSHAVTVLPPYVEPESEICAIHHPAGWPDGADGATCEHGVFWRYGQPSGNPGAGAPAISVDNWTDDEDLIR